MAVSTTKVLCKYFMSGTCTKGPLCPFSHDWKDKPDMICRYYLKGHCSYGDKCRYDHVRPKEYKEGNVMSRSLPAPVSLPSLSQSAASGTLTAPDEPKLVTLKKDPSKTPKLWIQAPEFVPGRKFHGTPDRDDSPPQETQVDNGSCVSYRDVVGMGVESADFLDIITPEEAASLLCPFAEMQGICPFGDKCDYLHGELCDMCDKLCLNPMDPEQQKAHRKDCLEMHTKEMERAFAVQGSEGKSCAVCMEIVTAKLVRSERRFGILSDCDHCFCLDCIRKWRSTTHSRKKTIRACPLCRMVSFFVIPSEVWIEDRDQKLRLIEEYKDNMSKKHCKYFNMGNGTCPFGNSCFYKHEYPDGTKAEIALRIATDEEGASKVVRDTTLWEFFNEREQRTGLHSENWEDSSSSDDEDRAVFRELLSPSQFRGTSEFDHDFLPFYKWANPD